MGVPYYGSYMEGWVPYGLQVDMLAGCHILYGTKQLYYGAWRYTDIPTQVIRCRWAMRWRRVCQFIMTSHIYARSHPLISSWKVNVKGRKNGIDFCNITLWPWLIANQCTKAAQSEELSQRYNAKNKLRLTEDRREGDRGLDERSCYSELCLGYLGWRQFVEGVLDGSG